MSGNSITNSTGLDLAKQYLKGLGIDESKVKSSDIASIFQTATKNDDGTVSRENFEIAVAQYYDQNELSELEDEYLEAWEAFAGADGNNESLSSGDISSMNAASANSAAEQTAANSAAMADRNGGSAPSPSASNGSGATSSKVSPLSLSGNESISDLQSGRSEAMKQLSEARASRNSNQDLVPYEDAVEESKAAYDEAVEQISSDDEEIQGQIEDIQDRKEVNDEAVASQKEIVDGLYDSISSQETIVSSTQSELDSLQQPNKDEFKSDDGEGNVTYPGYEEAVAEYEEQKAALEQQLQEAEDTLADLNVQLADAEDTLAALEEEGAGIEQELSTLISSEETEGKIKNADILQAALTTYQEAQQSRDEAKQELTAQLDADIDQLEANVAEYTAAIDEAKAAQEAEAEEDDSDPLSIDEGDEDTNAARNEETGVLEDLPPEYKDDPRIKVDENGNYYVEVEPYVQDDSSVNGCLYNIIQNSYDFDELGVPFSEAKEKLKDAIVEANNIADPNVVQNNQRINLVDPYKVLGIENPNAKETEEPAEVEENADETGEKVTLSEDEVAEVVDELLNGGKDAEGQRLSANDVWKNTDFSQYSPETISEIVNAYNEAGKDFIEKAEKVYHNTSDENDVKQFNSIVGSLVAQSAEDEQALSTLNNEVNKAIEAGDTRVLDALFDSGAEHLSELKLFIAQYDENAGEDSPISLSDAINASEKLSEEQKTAYNNLITDTENKIDVSEEDKELIDALSSEDEDVAYEAWKALASELDSADPEEITRLAQAYDEIVGKDGAFLEKARERYTTTYYDDLMDSIKSGYGDKTINGDTLLSDGTTNALDFAEALKSNIDNWDEDVLNALSSEDIAIIAELYGIEEFKSDAADAFGLSNYSKLNEKILDIDTLQEGSEYSSEITDPKALDYLNQLTDIIECFEDLSGTDLDISELESKAAVIMKDAIADSEISVKDRMYLMQTLATSNPELVQKLILTDNDVKDSIIGMFEELANCEQYERHDLLWRFDEDCMEGPYYGNLLNGEDDESNAIILPNILFNDVEYSFDQLPKLLLDSENYKSMALVQFATLFEQLSGQDLSYYIKSEVQILQDGTVGAPYEASSIKNSNSERALRYSNALAAMYKDTTPAQQAVLNQIFDTGNTIQYLLKEGKETECLKTLISNISSGLPESSSDYGIENSVKVEVLKDNYMKSGSNADKLKNILDGYTSDSSGLDKNTAKYLIRELCGGDLNNLTDIFRDISGGLFVGKTIQEEYLPILMEIIGSPIILEES